MVKVNQEIYKICIIHETLLVHWKLHDSWKSYMDSVDLDLYEFLEKYVPLESAEPQVWLCYRFCWREALLKMDFSSMFPLDHSTMTCSLLFGAQQLQLCLLCLTKAQMSQSFRKQLQDLGMYSTCTYVNILSAISMYIYFRL